MSQNEQILAYMRTGREITPLDALTLFSCFRLAARVSELRDKGHNIETRTVKRNGKSYAAYRLSTP